ncbi:MAG: hypothetical protein ABIE75_02205 [Candidatus Omnitrophota bacterium]
MRTQDKQFKQAQIVFEYVVIFAIVIAAIISTGFLSKLKQSFSSHYNSCVKVILQ